MKPSVVSQEHPLHTHLSHPLTSSGHVAENLYQGSLPWLLLLRLCSEVISAEGKPSSSNLALRSSLILL